MGPALLGSHQLWLLLAVATHAVAGFTVGSSTFDRPWAGALGGVLADVDLLFPGPDGAPLGHRGVTHSVLALGLAVSVAAYWGRDVAGAVGVGYVSQLAIDATTPKGIPLVYPLGAERLGVDWNLHSDWATAAILTCCAVVLVIEYGDVRRRLAEWRTLWPDSGGEPRQ